MLIDLLVSTRPYLLTTNAEVVVPVLLEVRLASDSSKLRKMPSHNLPSIIQQRLDSTIDN